MAGTSLLALIDDIATVLDDVAVLSKLATKKTAGVLGDDLALNAEQVTGVRPERELPVVWAVAKGSLFNKAILVPAALAVSTFTPWLVTPLLMCGGAFLCYEGFEKVAHKVVSSRHQEASRHATQLNALLDESVDLVAFEKAKIRGAIRTDFILSAEILAIALSTVAEAGLLTRVLVLVTISLAITVGVYGLVAGIVKLDDAGLYLSKRANAALRWIGRSILNLAPYLMKALGIAGTIAMFLVGGGILAHGIPSVHHWLEHLALRAGAFSELALTVMTGMCGVIAGGALVLIITSGKSLLTKNPA